MPGNPIERKAAATAELSEQLRQIRKDALDVVRDASRASEAAKTLIGCVELLLAPENLEVRLARAERLRADLEELTYNLERVAGNLAIPVREAIKLNAYLAAGDFTS